MFSLNLNDDDKAIIERLKELERNRYMKPKACIVCGTGIEQGYSGQTRRYCDRPGCRRRGARLLKIIERYDYEVKTTEKAREFAKELTPDSVSQLEFLLNSSWTSQHVDHGAVYNRSIDVVNLVMQMIDRERAAAFRKLERFTVVFEQRAERAEERVQELEEELHRLRLLLPQALHDEIERQPRYLSVVSADEPGARLDRHRAARLLLAEGHSSQSQDNEGDEEE